MIKSLAKICLIGVGNEIRRDDAMGPYIVRKMEALDITGVDCTIVHQLQTDLLPNLIRYEKVMIVDASVDGHEVRISPIEVHAASVSGTHHLNASVLALLATELYGASIQFLLCSVPGTNFEIGDQMSDLALQHADKAIQMITDFLNGSLQESR